MWEIETRKIPFQELNVFNSELEKLISINGVRPSIDNEDNKWNENYVGLMKSCWSENPFHRPTAREINIKLKELLKGEKKKINFLNQPSTDYQEKRLSETEIRKVFKIQKLKAKKTFRRNTTFANEPLGFPAIHEPKKEKPTLHDSFKKFSETIFDKNPNLNAWDNPEEEDEEYFSFDF